MSDSNSLNPDQAASAAIPASETTAKQPVDAQTKLLAAMAYGEASSQNDSDEMMAIASVLVRQRNARGYSDMATFTKNDRTFSFVVGDGNPRYNALMKAKDEKIEKDAGMQAAISAARNALAGGPDKSNGAYFWDGADIKTNYANHFKVRQGIKITDPSHNIYQINDSTNLKILYKTIKIKDKKSHKVTIKKEEIGRYDHVYDSTAAHGGTIFWKFSQEYRDVTKAKEYK
ncbi:hypothetical protein C7401_14344 [Paraburkholderia unamae]|uniref:hypothetical protein n=1 Tax=Paraburkholderia unamae TaxID=219649 RepID=UPI000DC41AF4|nr:hypothetical protein [Paraburkholderia unamae]RAR50052.1 hypothetical protein C7401_14344 [Paraburkholderia unamae]